MIVFTTLHNDEFKLLADLTLPNKKTYCEKHNYPLIINTDNWHNIPIGFEKAYLIKDAFDTFPDCEWVFFSECDTLITNMDIKLEDIIKNEEKHFVITTDINGINAGSFFIKNSHEGNEFLQDMFNGIGKFNHEQEFIIDSFFISRKHHNKISLYPQRKFNSYIHNWNDLFGNNGQWQENDFIIHFPGIAYTVRLDLSREYLLKVKNI
jgi:mannan polymerase II complex MNN10 subunit